MKRGLRSEKIRWSVTIAAAAAAIALPGIAGATTTVSTAPLRAIDSSHVCRVTNNNSVSPGVSVTINVVNSSTGAADCTWTGTITPSASTQLECTGAAIRRCDVVASTATIADNLVVAIFLKDPWSHPAGAVSATGTPTLINGYAVTPGLVATSNMALECLCDNTGTSSAYATAQIVDDTGAVVVTQSGTLLAGHGLVVRTPVFGGTFTGGAYCRAYSTSSTLTKALRLSLSGVFWDPYTLLTNSDSISPIGNQ